MTKSAMHVNRSFWNWTKRQ